MRVCTDGGRVTRPEVANGQLQLLPWLIPALTGGTLVSSALHGEQQRATNASKAC